MLLVFLECATTEVLKMTIPGSYQASTYNLNLDQEVKRLKAQLRLTWKKEARNLKWFGLQDGMSVLEMGCGAGHSTEALLSLLPNSHITSVEIDPVMLEQTRQLLQPFPQDRFTLVEASGTNCGLPDNSIDFAVARLIFQHVPQPLELAREILRVLKPGGKLAVTDVDGDLFWLFSPPLPEADLISEKLGEFQASKSGNRYIGRQLWRMFKNVGFHELELELLPAHSDDLGIEAFLPQLDPNILLGMHKAGLLSDRDLVNIKVSRDAMLSHPECFVLLNWFMVCGTKPTVP